jgi:hypothetical protein
MVGQDFPDGLGPEQGAIQHSIPVWSAVDSEVYCRPEDEMIWTAYLDESCSHNSPTMLMGGYLANTEQWDAFNPAWGALLKPYICSWV